MIKNALFDYWFNTLIKNKTKLNKKNVYLNLTVNRGCRT